MTSDSSPKVAIGVLNFNGKEHLAGCLGSLAKTRSDNYEVFLVDNGSTDSSIDFVRENYPWAKIVSYHTNVPLSVAYNNFVNKIVHDIVVFLNNDTEVDPNWLNPLVETLQSSDRIAACGSLILGLPNKQMIAHAGGKLNPIGSGTDLGIFSDLSNIKATETRRLSGFACGAALAVRRSMFLKVGGLDVDYVGYHDDVDLCWRFWLNGYHVLTSFDSVVYHKGGATRGIRSAPHRVLTGERNRLVNMFKNYGFQKLFTGICMSLYYSSTLLFSHLMARRADTAMAVVKANWQFLKDMRRTIGKRKFVQGHRVLSDSTLAKMGLIATMPESIAEFRRLGRVEKSSKNKFLLM